MVVLAVVGGGDLGQEASNHLDDIRDGHFTDFILWADICRIASLPS